MPSLPGMQERKAGTMPETFETRRYVLKPTMRPCSQRLELERGVGACITGIFRTLWGTRDQIAKTFGCTEDNVRKHILNLLKDGGWTKSQLLENILKFKTKVGAKSRGKLIDTTWMSCCLSGIGLAAQRLPLSGNGQQGH